jgi:hypothetical protein
MRPTDWNADGSDDNKPVALFAKPELERWNHYYTRSSTQVSARNRADKRLQIVRKRVMEVLLNTRAERKRIEDELARAAAAEE